MAKTLFVFFLLISSINADDLDFKQIFSNLNIDGTLVVSSLKSTKTYIYNQQRADTRFTAASTFKIPHTLIILNENLLINENDIIKWDNIKRGYDLWNKDQTLKSAISVSCVWCYKQFTQYISKEKYLDYLNKFNYGNKTIGIDKSSFWLNGDLKISAYEQIDFLKKLYNNNLPINQKHLDTTKNILSIDKNEYYELKAKSGWDGNVGWYVGYIITQQNIYFFAMNANVNRDQLSLRKSIVMAALKSKKII